jgi:nucleoside-diphosphate-sugar epimerase
MRVLITGGAGVIGSHPTDVVLRIGHSIAVLDSLAPQVHGVERHNPPYLADDAQLARRRYPHRARRAKQTQGNQHKPTFRAEHNARQFTGGTIFVGRSLV